MQILLKGISVHYEGLNYAVDSIDFKIDRDEFFLLLGGIGSGKSTLLRIIAGLEKPSDGEIFLNGVSGEELRVRDRNICYIGDSCNLLKGKNVGKGITYGLKIRKFSKKEREFKLKEVADKLELRDWLKIKHSRRKPLPDEILYKAQLARAIVREPSILIFDDPFLGLDFKIKDVSGKEKKKSLEAVALDCLLSDKKSAMLNLTATVIKSLSVTTIFVTSDTEEAEFLSNALSVEYKTLASGKLNS